MGKQKIKFWLDSMKTLTNFENPSSNHLQTACCGIQETAYDSVNCFEACYVITFHNRWVIDHCTLQCSSWVGIYTHPISSLPKFVLCVLDCCHFQRLIWDSQFPLSCRQSRWGGGKGDSNAAFGKISRISKSFRISMQELKMQKI